MCIHCCDGQIKEIDFSGKSHEQDAILWLSDEAGFGFGSDAGGNVTVFVNAGDCRQHKTLTVAQLRQYGRRLLFLAEMAENGYDWDKVN